MSTSSGSSFSVLDSTKASMANPDQRPYVVCVEGNIGSGKTTFLEHFRNLYPDQIKIHAEPVNQWRNVGGHNLFQLMYDDPTRWALAFQHYVQLTLMRIHQDASRKEGNVPVHLMERSLFSARYCFVENLHKKSLLSDVEFVVIDEWFKFLTSQINFNYVHIDLIVYLKTDPQVVYERIKARCRQEEMSLKFDYVEELHRLHEKWLIEKANDTYLPAPVIVIDANESLENVLHQYNKHANKILGRYSGLLSSKSPNLQQGLPSVSNPITDDSSQINDSRSKGSKSVKNPNMSINSNKMSRNSEDVRSQLSSAL